VMDRLILTVLRRAARSGRFKSSALAGDLMQRRS
jgi:hypothetical protein